MKPMGRVPGRLSTLLTIAGVTLIGLDCFVPYLPVCDVPTAVGFCSSGGRRVSLYDFELYIGESGGVANAIWYAVAPAVAAVIAAVSMILLILVGRTLVRGMLAGLLAVLGGLTVAFFIFYLQLFHPGASVMGVVGGLGGLLLCASGVLAATSVLRSTRGRRLHFHHGPPTTG